MLSNADSAPNLTPVNVVTDVFAPWLVSSFKSRQGLV